MEVIINVCFAAVVVWFAYRQFGPAKGLRSLRSEAFLKELEAGGSLLIDVREAAEYHSGHIPGARNMPLSRLGERLSELPKEGRLLLYCRSGMRSKTAARLLKSGGYVQLAHLKGGLGAWSGKLTK
ncbi:rhodanese-like domain-containing protein [Paenibacillus montanisoli]|uniref:Rhodanese-like domain-containing protein n=1 Tax=Paenibacillus montanisoli TaxID=2081970 RepID=A0A328U001_9BACL|nr:rhodanese-like domain-containing protein [Paenibacillus montanisoli]RAP74175.1 rhodanese-like domain-containing protein [Paenibacillus montanisoli]